MEAIMSLDTRKEMLQWLSAVIVVAYWIGYPTGDKLERKFFDSYEKAVEWVRKNKKMLKSIDIM